jgi:hypothetical protein
MRAAADAMSISRGCTLGGDRLIVLTLQTAHPAATSVHSASAA